jgi:hypothetical protein
MPHHTSVQPKVTSSNRVLKIVYTILFFLITIFTLFYFFANPAYYGGSETEQTLFFISSILVALFIFWVQWLLLKYLPTSNLEMLYLILTPFIIIVLQIVLNPVFILGNYVAYLGVVTITNYLIPFTFLVYFGPWLSTTNNSTKDWKYYVLLCVVESVFIVPGGILIYFFMRSFLLSSTLPLFTISWLNNLIRLAIILVPILVSSYYVGKNLKKQSVY